MHDSITSSLLWPHLYPASSLLQFTVSRGHLTLQALQRRAKETSNSFSDLYAPYLFADARETGRIKGCRQNSDLEHVTVIIKQPRDPKQINGVHFLPPRDRQSHGNCRVTVILSREKTLPTILQRTSVTEMRGISGQGDLRMGMHYGNAFIRQTTYLKNRSQSYRHIMEDSNYVLYFLNSK